MTTTNDDAAMIAEIEALLPCVSCGAAGKMIHPMVNWMSREVGYGPNGSRVACAAPATECCMMTPAFYGPDQDAHAIAAWNRRTPLARSAAMPAKVVTVQDLHGDMHADPSFIVAWMTMEAQGYRYGDDALEQVYFGWQLARLTEAATPADDGWQSIKSAPKDGTPILLIGEYPMPGLWSDVYQGWAETRLRGSGRFRPLRWMRWPHDWPPTHWRPLPAPPGTVATPADDLAAKYRAALEQIEGGHIPGGGDLAVAGNWHGLFDAAQAIAHTALNGEGK